MNFNLAHRGVKKKIFLLYIDIRTLSPTLNFGLDDKCSLSPFK